MIKRIALLIICLLSFPICAVAAPKTMADGQLFDAEYYGAIAPGANEFAKGDEFMLYVHYVNIGKPSGLLPYDIEMVAGDKSINTSKQNFPLPLNKWTQTVSEQGCPIFICYSTYNNIGDIRWKGKPTPDIFGEDAGELLWTAVCGYRTASGDSTGFHFLYPVTKMGKYVEGNIYKCIAGAHHYTDKKNCPFNPDICRVGTVD